MDLSVGPGATGDWKSLDLGYNAFRKLMDLSVGAGRERPGMEKASISIEIL